MKIGAQSKNPELQIRQLREQTEEYKKAHALFVRGQNIQQLEEEAKKTVASAKQEALKILSDARQRLEGIDATKASLATREAAIVSKEKEIARKETQTDALNQAALSHKADHDSAMAKALSAEKEANSIVSQYQAKFKDLKKALDDLARNFG